MSKNTNKSKTIFEVGDVVTNFINIGKGRSWRSKESVTGVVLEKNISLVAVGEKKVERTDLTLLLSDGAVHTYDDASFRVINKLATVDEDR